MNLNYPEKNNIISVSMVPYGKLLIILFLSAKTVFLSAQTSPLPSGGNGNGPGGSVSYSVGLVFFRTASGVNGTVTEGVQQPYEISVMTAISNTEEISLECFIYPNPTHGKVKLIVGTDTFRNLRIHLYDLHGKIIQDLKIENDETEIIMDGLLASTYILKVFNGRKEIKTFKIIKH